MAGQLIDGYWRHEANFPTDAKGAFDRPESDFRNWITPDGAPGPSGEGGFEAEPGRYHLYVSYACPWASRALVFRALKGLEEMVGLSVVDPLMLENGWEFSEKPGCIPDTVNGFTYLHQLYTKAEPGVSCRAVVPVLWDKARSTIVSNESSEIIRMFNSAFDGCGARPGDYYPKALRAEIDAVNDRVYRTVNNGVYRAGFARSQNAYEKAFGELFDTLDWLDSRLGRQRYLAGGRITEADWRLFTTLVRFDLVYHTHFKCNRRRLVDYPSLWAYTRELYQVPGIAGTVNFDHIRRHYYVSQPQVNPSRIVAVGPDLDFAAPHGRERIGTPQAAQ